MAPAIAAGEPVLFFTETVLGGGRRTTAVLTESALILNSAYSPEKVDHTEVMLRIPLQEIHTIALAKTAWFDRLMAGFHGEHITLSTRDGNTRGLYFREEGKAVAMHAELSQALAGRGSEETN